MNIKLKAVLHTVALFATAIVAGSAIHYLFEYVDTETLHTILGGAVIGGFVYMTYQLCLTRLEYYERFDKK